MAAGGGLGMLVLILIVMFLGGNPQALLQQMQQNAPPAGGQQQQGPRDPAEEKLATFVKQILASTEDVWTDIFRQRGGRYEQPKLVLFTGQVESACGYANAAVGPFYCPADSKVYIDLQFYSDLQDRFNAAGDFAQAYVIAHEVGHHVQNQLGISEKVHAMKQGRSEAEANELSVRQELQADFFAGVWAHHADRARQIMERGDLEEGLRAASAIGDDRLQMQSRGFVVPEKFTHGSSAQRVRWFRRGFETGDMKQGDTFGAREL